MIVDEIIGEDDGITIFLSRHQSTWIDVLNYTEYEEAGWNFFDKYFYCWAVYCSEIDIRSEDC